MKDIMISNLDEGVVRKLRQQAFEEGVPLEDSLKRILSDAARAPKTRSLDQRFPAPTD
jgi:plasmid stability protein